MANVIYRGPVEREPETLTCLVGAPYLPGVLVESDGTNFTLSADGLGRVLLLNNRRYYTQTDVDAYETGEHGNAYRLEVEQEYRAVLGAGTYAIGDALSWKGTAFGIAAAGEKVLAYYDGEGETLAAAGLADIVIANAYIAA